MASSAAMRVLFLSVSLLNLFPTQGWTQSGGLDALNRQYRQLHQLHREKKYAKASKVAERALALAEKTLGKDHPLVGTALNILAELHWNQSRYGEAESLFKRSLAIKEEALGKDHPDVATMLNDLASLYDSQGRYGEAESLFKRSLAIRETKLDMDHPYVATTLSNLAGLHRNRGRYGEIMVRRRNSFTESSAHKEARPGPDIESRSPKLDRAHNQFGSLGNRPDLTIPSKPQPRNQSGIETGNRLLRVGRVRKARLIFESNMTREPVRAALALAKSYDPNFLANVANPDALPHVPTAKKWYRDWHRLSVERNLISKETDISLIIRSMKK